MALPAKLRSYLVITSWFSEYMYSGGHQSLKIVKIAIFKML